MGKVIYYSITVLFRSLLLKSQYYIEKTLFRSGLLHAKSEPLPIEFRKKGF